MAVSSLERLLDRLVETGVISKQQFRELQERKNPDDTLPSMAGVTRRLVTKGILTQFQAEHLADGEPERLVIGEYVLIDLLGSGGMGEVYLARHKMMQREVAIKLLIPKSSELIESIERFKREVRAAARLSHPNIVTALDAGVRGGQYYLVMEYVKGRNLAYLVKSQGAIRLDRALDYTIQAGQGLEYAHRQGIIHRDIKPSNLLVGEDGTVKVSDLGLSRVLQRNEEVTDVNDDGDGLTSSGMIMGTVDFMAPEQALSPRDADERADIYGLGCTLYFLATGAAVYRGDTPMARLIAHREQPVPAITEALPNAPNQLDDVLARMLAKEPDDRYASISDALRDLRSCLRQYQEGLSNLPETEFRTLAEPAPARRSAFVLLAVLAAIAAGVAGASGLFSSPSPDESLVSRPDEGARLPSRNGQVSGGESTIQGNQPVTTPVLKPVLHELATDSEPVDVLGFLDLNNVRLNGDGWFFENDRKNLVMGKADRARLGVPVVVPKSYWLSLDVRRRPMAEYVKGPFVIGLTVGSSGCIAALDAHRASGARISFLGNNRFSEATLFTSQYLKIPDDDFVTIRIEVDVRADDIASVSVSVGDSEPLMWEGDPADIEIPIGWSSDWPEPIFIASNMATQYEIRNFRIGPGELPPEEPAADVPAAERPATEADSAIPQP